MIKNNKFIPYILILLIPNILSFSAYTLSREERILTNIKPLGEVYLAAGAQLQASAAPILSKDAGVKRYKTSCYICHDTGASGAPKLSNQAEWASRLKEGKDILYDHAIKGYKAMPPKGTCMSCSDEEIKLTVDYMMEKSR